MFSPAGCGHCKKMKPEYDEAAEYLNKDKNVSTMMVYIQGAFDA